MKKGLALLLCVLLMTALCGVRAEEAPDAISVFSSLSHLDLEPYRGKAVFLDVFANWCGPCMSEMPSLKILSEEFADSAVFLLINCDGTEEDNAAVREEFGLTGVTFLLDSEAQIGGLLDQVLGGQGYIPCTMVLDRNGSPVWGDYGALPEASLRAILQYAVNVPAPEAAAE